MTRRIASLPMILAALLLAVASPTQLQSAGLADLIPDLFARDLLLAPPGEGFPSHEAHFLDEAAALRSTGQLLNQSLVTQLSAFPLASSAGGFTFRFDPELGVPTRATDTFAPIFTERSYTNGEGRWSFGLTHLRADYQSLDGLDLTRGDLVFQLRHIDLDPSGPLDPFFEGDLINAELALGVETDTTVLFASYGVSDRLDLGVALPVVQIDLDAAATLTIDRLSTADSRGIHQFEDDDTDQVIFSDSGFASGPGDLVLRAKYRFLDRPVGGMALLSNLQLPTGDEDDLLGSGQTKASLVLIGSRRWEKVAGHFNLGYGSAFGDSSVVDDLPDEVLANVALEFAASPRVTVTTEVVGRQLLDAPTIERRLETFEFLPGPGRAPAVAGRPVVSFSEQDQELVFGAFGVKWNVIGNVVLSGAVLTPFTDDGLRDGRVLVFGADLSF